MITYVVLYPGEIATGATFVAEQPTLELAADALARLHGNPVIGFAPLH
jgi:hypothetical protein